MFHVKRLTHDGHATIIGGMTETEFMELQEGEAVRTPDGTGSVVHFNEWTVLVKLENGESYTYKMEQLSHV